MKPRLKPIQDQVVVLVGATSGIGLDTAMHMAEKGAQVVIVGRSQEGLNDALMRVRAHADATRMMRMQRTGGGYYESSGMSGASGYGTGGMGSTSGMGTSGIGSTGGISTGGMGNTGGMGSSSGMGTGGIGSTGTMGTGGMQSAGTGTATMEEQIIALEGDITDFEQMRSVADQVVQRFGRIDTWANIAAVSEWALFEDTSPDEFRRVIEVNLIGHAYAAMAALPYLRQQRGGALIFVSSIAGRLPVPYQSAYNASKHGILGLVETLRQELKHTGTPVSVTAIIPASVNTPLFEKGRTKLGVEPDPMPPIYDSKMVAQAITFAASHPVRELMVGDAGHMLTFMKRLAPTLTNNFMGSSGFRKQRSNEPKSAQAPDNLYEHISGYNQVEGDYTHRQMKVAPLTYLSTHPRARMAIFGSLLAGLGLIAGWRIVKARQYRRSWRYRLPHQARLISKQARVKASNALHRAGDTISGIPVVSSLPMFHHPTFMERVGDTLTGLWAGLIAILPFTQRRSKVAKQASRLSMAKQREILGKRISKTSEQVRHTIADRRKDAMKAVDRTTDRVKDEVKDRAKDRPVMRTNRRVAIIGRHPVVEREKVVEEKVTVRR